MSRTFNAAVMPRIRTYHQNFDHRDGTGRRVTTRHAHSDGRMKVDSRTREWCYYEKVKETGQLVASVWSKGWKEFMDRVNPDFIPMNAEFIRTVELRRRAF